MRKYLFLILLLFTSYLKASDESKESVKEIKDFYKNYSIYKIKRVTEAGENEDSKNLDKIKDNCMINYLSKEIKKTDYQNYLLSLPVNDTNKYDKLIIDLAIKSAGSLSDDWNFMHEYLRNIADIERLYEQLNEYSIDDMLSFFLVYFMYYGDAFPELNEMDYKEEVKKIKKFNNLKKNFEIINKKFKEFEDWDLKTEGGLIERIGEKYQNSNYDKSFYVNISNSVKIYGRIYENKEFVILVEAMDPNNVQLKIIHEEFIDVNSIQFYTFGPNFFIIKKSGNDFILTKYGYNIKESKLEVLDKAKLDKCF